MKRYMTKYFALTGGLLMLASLSGCQLDDPVIPAEELYIRGFIKKYGLIDPTQDFSSAVQTTITLDIPGKASVVNIYAKMGNDLYRVGCFAELQGTVSLPVDVSEATETIVVDVDGVRYYTTQNGHVQVKSGSSAATSRAGETWADNLDLKSLWIEPSGWAALKNGETGNSYTTARQKIVIESTGKLSGGVKKVPSVDGKNYFDVYAAGHIGKNLLGEQSHQTTFANYLDGENPGEVATTYNGSNVRFLIENKDAPLSAYTFTFRTASKNEGEVRVVILGQHTNGQNDNGVYVFMDSKNLEVNATIDHKNSLNTTTVVNKTEMYTEWELRTEMMPQGYYEVIIMGVDSKANVDGDRTCGNWGFMTINRCKTATDMRWILACEDLGTTDDFDFNDVVFSIEAVNTNTAALDLGVIQWQVVDNPAEGTIIRPGGTTTTPSNAPASRAGAATNSDLTTQVKVTALAAGGTLPIWLHFREEDATAPNGGIDYLVCPSHKEDKDGCLLPVEERAETEITNENNGEKISICNEWHRWFGRHNSKEMLNTGVSAHIPNTESVTFYTKKPFSLQNFSYLKFDINGADIPYITPENVEKLDPWSEKVLLWKWQQENSQKVTFGFFLTVYSPTVDGTNGMKSHIISKSLEGLPPQMFLIPDCNPMSDVGTESKYVGWSWPCERTDITVVYPNFQTWVKDGAGQIGMNWFMLPASTADPKYDLYPRDGGIVIDDIVNSNPNDHSGNHNNSNN